MPNRAKLNPLIVVNKMDLIESPEFASNINKLYHNRLGYKILELSAPENCADLRPYLKISKSAYWAIWNGEINILTKFIRSNGKTAEITKYETSGSHTTTNASLTI